MEIEIESKRNNPLLNRTEIYFTIKHEGEGTPNREIIKSELAEKLNVKKESIIVSTIDSSFGIQQISGYAKVYSSDKKTKDFESDYILVRNNLMEREKKAKKEVKAPPTAEAKPEISEEAKSVEPVSEEKQPEPKLEPVAPDQPKEETPEKEVETKEEDKKPLEEEKEIEKDKPEQEQPIEDKKELIVEAPDDKQSEKFSEEQTQTEEKKKDEKTEDEKSEEKKE